MAIAVSCGPMESVRGWQVIGAGGGKRAAGAVIDGSHVRNYPYNKDPYL